MKSRPIDDNIVWDIVDEAISSEESNQSAGDNSERTTNAVEEKEEKEDDAQIDITSLDKVMMQSLSAETEIERVFSGTAVNVIIDIYTMDHECPSMTVELEALGNDDEHSVAKRLCKRTDIEEPYRYGLLFQVTKGASDMSQEESSLFSDLERHVNRWVVSGISIQSIESTVQNVLVHSRQSEEYSKLQYKWVQYKWCYSPNDKALRLETDEYADLLYLQAVYDVQSGKKFRLSHTKSAMVAIIQFVMTKRGRSLYAEEIPQVLETIPQWIRGTTQDHEWTRLCMQSSHKLLQWQKTKARQQTESGLPQEISSMDYERLYLGVVQSNHMYGMTYFPVRWMQPKRWSRFEQLLLGVNWHYVVVCDNSYRVLKSMKMKNIKSLKQSSKVRTQIELQYRDSTNKMNVVKFASLNFKAAFIATQLYDLRTRIKKKPKG